LGRVRVHDGEAPVALTSGGNLAGLARVAFEAVTGEFNADVKQSEAIYRDATRGMSDDSIRLELSQERLRRELAKGPSNYRAIARAELEVRRSEQSLRGENERLERQFRETGRQANNMGRGMLAGSGALRGMGRNLAFASAGFLGGTGLIYGMRNAIGAASNLEEQTNKVGVTFQAAGKDVIAWSGTTATTMGIASDQALEYAGTLGGILKASGLARKESAGFSMELVGLAADMASFNNTSIEDALQAIRSGLVGESEPLRRFQVLLTEANVSQEAMRMTGKKTAAELTQGDKVLARRNLILKQTTDQQGDYARTADGLANSQRTLSALWREANIIVGQALVPAFKDAVQGARDWLAEDENREQMQRTVNQLVKDGEQVVRGFVKAMRLVKDVSEPVVDALGGVGNAVEAMTVLWVAWKVKALLGFGATAAASKTTATSMVADATVAGRAWDIATRPRVMTVTTAGVGGGTYVGSRGSRGFPVRGGLRNALPILTTNPALATAAAVLAASGAAGAKTGDRVDQRRRLLNGEYGEQFPHLTNAAYFVVNGQGTAAQKKAIRAVWDNTDANGYAAQERMLIKAEGAYTSGPHRTTPPPVTGGGGKGGGGKGGSTFTMAQFESQQATIQERAIDAEPSASTADDVKYAKAELALIRRALAELSLTRDQRVALKQRRNALLADLASIEQQDEQEAQAIRDKRDAARKAARAKREAREKAEQEAEANHMDKVMKRAQAHYDRMAKLTKGTDFSTRKGLRAAALRYVDKDGKPKATGDDKPPTAGEIARMLHDFASGLHGVIGSYAGNVGDSPADYGMMGTQSQLQTMELAKQTQILENFTGAVRHPFTGYHRTEGTTTLLGVGF